MHFTALLYKKAKVAGVVVLKAPIKKLPGYTMALLNKAGLTKEECVALANHTAERYKIQVWR